MFANLPNSRCLHPIPRLYKKVFSFVDAQNSLYWYGMKRYWVDSADRLAYACSMVVDFARLRSRICCAVNSPPQTLQRQPGDAAGATIDPGC